MNTYGKLVEPTTLRFERMMPGPIEKVWDYITDGEKRARWFAGGPTDLRAGGDMELVFHNSQLGSPSEPTPEKYKEFGDGFRSPAKILTCTPPVLFVIEWEGIVTFKLEEEGAGVKLTLTHEKLQDTKETRVGTLAGWHTHLDILVDRLNEVEPKGFWAVHMAHEKEYEEMIS
ncbi:MAG: SRPBCC family protein [Cyclobacteriaceae bacterium]